MRLCLLTIYACFYYTILILYIVRLLLSLMLFCSVSIFILFFIFLCLSIFFMIFLFDGGVRLSDFFVISTLLNTTLVFGFLTALLYTI